MFFPPISFFWELQKLKASALLRGEDLLHGTTLIIFPFGKHLSHSVTGMNRSVHHGLLQSGCPAALARGSHRFPSR